MGKAGEHDRASKSAGEDLPADAGDRPVPCIAMRHGIVSNYEDLAVEQRTTVVQNQLMILANHLSATII